MPHRYFTTEISDGTATLRGADAHHLARVMRAKPGETVILCDGNAVEYTATITGFGEDRVDFAVGRWCHLCRLYPRLGFFHHRP